MTPRAPSFAPAGVHLHCTPAKTYTLVSRISMNAAQFFEWGSGSGPLHFQRRKQYTRPIDTRCGGPNGLWVGCGAALRCAVLTVKS